MLNIDEFLVSGQGRKVPFIGLREFMNQFLKSAENYDKFMNFIFNPMAVPAT